MSARFRLAIIPSVDKALRDLGTFAFVFSEGGRNLSDVSDLLRLIARLDELHAKV